MHFAVIRRYDVAIGAHPSIFWAFKKGHCKCKSRAPYNNRQVPSGDLNA